MTNTATLIPPAIIKEGTFAVDGKLFADTVAVIAKAAGRLAGMAPVIVLAFKDQRLTLSATDFEVTASVKIPVKGKRAAVVAVEASALNLFAKALASEPVVEIVTGQEEVLVQAGDTVYHLPPVQDFAKIANPEPVAPQALDLPAFQRAVKIAGVAASTDEARPVLTGIWFQDGVAVATDSFRLAVVADAPAGLNGLVPAVAARLAAQLFGADEEVTFDIVGQNLVLRSASKLFVTRLIQGDFPAYQNLMRPTSGDQFSVLVSRDQMAKAVNKVKVASGGGATPMKAEVVNGSMHLSVRPHDGPRADDDVELTSGSVDVPTVGMNPQFLAQLLGAVSHVENIQFGYVDSLKPINITAGGDDESWTMLLMPVRIP